MDAQTVETLCKLNDAFYRRHCDSFSQTRNSPWPGWKRCLEAAGWTSNPPARASVFDLACGNLRFEAFLADRLPHTDFVFHAVDNCDELVEDGRADIHAVFQDVDVMEVLREGRALSDEFQAPPCDFACAFGFLHHVPTARYRESVLRALLDQTKPGGICALSFWQFLNNPAMAEKARNVHARAWRELHLPPLERGDFLIGWKGIPGEYRYCHSFSDEEIDDLAAAVADSAVVVARFNDDGRTGNLNAYVVLRRV